ncbi:Uncharacterised protein [Mycolicibacterium phlei]|nr:hypothetical protein GR01_00700 [Mycobacteroides chelonae]ANB00771.1 hypothetical protein BB28_00730 [Mycobacteroides chelonae CCUG 47445]OLT81445.1 hypothetical protein BKG56_04250 [Mycobacteroides chelonae]ORV17478.1 hypothetical protein AWB96_04540 [Mycobacteroides chelonae]VEG14295.1 Uncharacterised protein [Mycolicibacterium phlei]
MFVSSTNAERSSSYFAIVPIGESSAPDGCVWQALRLRPRRSERMQQTLNIQTPFPIRSLAVNEVNLKIMHTQKGYGVIVPSILGRIVLDN